MAEGGRVWIEERHNRVFELDVARARTREAAAIIESLPGRPARPGGFVHARKLADGAVILRVNTAVAGEQRCSLRFPDTVASVVALETDGDGRTYVAVRRENSAPPGGARSDLVVTRLRSCGPPAESLVLPDAYVTDHYRKVFVTVSGEVIQLQTTEAGVRFVRWAFEERLRRGAMP